MMKRIRILIFAVSGLLTAVIFCMFVTACAENTAESNLDIAFAEKGPLRLVRTDLLPEDLREELMPVGLSPDGKAILCRKNRNELCIVRDGTVIPVSLAPDQGVGDPNGTLERYPSVFLSKSPADEGFSWSADSRYITLSDISMVLDKKRPMDVPVLDTITGKLWLADSYDSGKGKLSNAGNGFVYLCRFSRNDACLYYLTRENTGSGKAYRLCRCRTDGTGKEVLCEMPTGEEDQMFELNSYSRLFEVSGESWILIALEGPTYTPPRNQTLSAIRFSPSEDQYTAELFSLNISFPITSPIRSEFSEASGYGLISLFTADSPVNNPLSQMSEDQLNWYPIADMISLLRIRPGADVASDVWYLKGSREDSSRIELVTAEDYVSGLLRWASGEEAVLPAGYDRQEAIGHLNPQVRNCCLSPDGRYALLTVCVREPERIYRFCLLSLETMDILPVEAPESLAGNHLVAGSAFGQQFRPRMVWNDDGTLLIIESDNMTSFFRIEGQ